MIRLEVSVMFIAFTIEQRIDGFQVANMHFVSYLVIYRIELSLKAKHPFIIFIMEAINYNQWTLGHGKEIFKSILTDFRNFPFRLSDKEKISLKHTSNVKPFDRAKSHYESSRIAEVGLEKKMVKSLCIINLIKGCQASFRTSKICIIVRDKK